MEWILIEIFQKRKKKSYSSVFDFVSDLSFRIPLFHIFSFHFYLKMNIRNVMDILRFQNIYGSPKSKW